MKVLFYLHHPAHFHLLKNVIRTFQTKGNKTIILATKKDILEELLTNERFEYINVLPNGRKDNKLSIILGLLKQDFRLLKICLKNRPDLLIGTSTEIAHIGRLLNIPNIFLNEDDIDVVPLVGNIAYPFSKHILTPDVCKTGKWKFKTINYAGYHELAYLYPQRFTPEKHIVAKYFSPDEPYFILRFAKLGAHHDGGIKGITTEIAEQVIRILEPYGDVYITSERQLEGKFEKYRMNINPLDIHHIMSFAQIYIGDSQTMAAEAAVLGTPFIRFNDFVGRIGYLSDLEDKYILGFGIKSNEKDRLFTVLKELIDTPNLKQEWLRRRDRMISEKIDVTSFLLWIIEEYPQSFEIMKKSPDYQYNFK